MSRFLVILGVLWSVPAWAAGPCDEGNAALKAKDLTRASITVDECMAADPVAGAKLEAAVDKQAEAKGYSTIEVVTKPDGATVVVDTAADRPFVAPRKVWVKAGYRELDALEAGQPVAGSTFRIGEHSHAVILIEMPKAEKAGGEVKEIDFTDDPGGEIDMTTGPPPDEKFKNLLPDRYLKGVNAEGEVAVASGERSWWRIAALVGMRTVTGAPGGLGFEIEHRSAVGGPWSIAGVVSTQFGYAPDSAMDEPGGLVLQLSGAALVQVALPLGTRLGLGPSAAAVAAPFGGSGQTFGGAATAEIAHGGLTVGLRMEAPVLASRDRALTGALLCGYRW